MIAPPDSRLARIAVRPVCERPPSMQQAADNETIPGRVLSYTEISAALDCQARWDFSYGDFLAGDSLRPKQVAPRLSEGRAWGAAVAKLHAPDPDQLLSPRGQAIEAAVNSLVKDGEQMREFGFYDEDAAATMRDHLAGLVDHYESSNPLDPIDPVLERELLVPLPSRSGSRSSSRFKLLAYLDGTRTLEGGGVWLVEFKLRSRLSAVAQIALSRQIRWYAWAYWRATGIKPVGVETRERLNEVPKDPRIVNAKRKGEGINGKVPSHATDQLCTSAAYRAVCEKYEVDPRAETLEALEARRWQQVVPIMFRDGELDEAGRELVSAAKLISYLDSGRLMPVRNATPRNCPGCSFKDICPAPDTELVDALFYRRPPKREPRREEADDSSNIAAGQQTVPF